MTGPHHCPGCGTPLEAVPRYPWHFCQDCCASATDGQGGGLRFGNATAGGGFTVGPNDGTDPSPCLGAICLIRGRPVLVREARFGGVVAEPMTADPPRRPGLIDLRSGWPGA